MERAEKATVVTGTTRMQKEKMEDVLPIAAFVRPFVSNAS